MFNLNFDIYIFFSMLCLTYFITIIYAHHVSYHSKHVYARVQSGIRNKHSCLVCAGEEKAKFKFFLDQCLIPTNETVSSARVKVAWHKIWDRKSPRNSRESYAKLMPFFSTLRVFNFSATSRLFRSSSLVTSYSRALTPLLGLAE